MIRRTQSLPRTTLLAIAMCIALPATSAQSPNSTRPESQQEYWAQFDRRDWDAATSAAATLVTAARARTAREPLRLSEALTLLGNAQLGKADYPAAEASFREALQIAEQNAGRTSGALLDPLHGLGATLAASGNHTDAIPQLDRALVIAHRNRGLFDIAQQGILRQLATSLTKTGQLAEAERDMEYMVRVAQRTYGERDPRTVPAIVLLGDWHADTGNFVTARLKYRAALALAERKLGKQDIGVVEPLRALARSYTQELYYATVGLRVFRKEGPSPPSDADGSGANINPRFLNTEGERSLERAIKVLDLHPPGAEDSLIDTLIQLGDWHQTKQQFDKALPYYKRASSIFASLPAAASNPIPSPLSFPSRVFYPQPAGSLRNLMLPDEAVDKHYVQVEFNLTAEGNVKDARVVDEDAPGRYVSETLDAVRSARYRPKFVNGEPVSTQAMSIRETFRMRKTTATESSAK
jgi:tetratricopeptide (TPR) repeat protein